MPDVFSDARRPRDAGPGRHTPTAQALHWLTVLLILGILPVAWVMVSLPKGAEQAWTCVLHRSLGVTIRAVAAVRLVRRGGLLGRMIPPQDGSARLSPP